MKIAFTNIDGEDLGYAEYTNGTLTGSNDERSADIDQWISGGYTPEEYVEYFREWSNGYLTSYTVGANETPTEETETE
jgi:hypothetical protein